MKFRIISYHFSIYLLLFFLTPFLFHSSAGAADLSQFHTIQAGSYSQEPPATRLFHSLAESLAPDQRDYLRVEKVGGYYTVRLGRFGSWSEADRIVGAAGEPLAGALILQAHNKPERISLLYEPVLHEEASLPLSQDTASVPKKSVNDILPVSPEKETAAETLAPTTNFATGFNEQQEYYTIQVGSYSIEDAAEKKYQFLVKALRETQRDHLRIEKVQGYHTVRIGRFESLADADAFLGTVGEPLDGANILQAYIKAERISRQYQSAAELVPAPVALVAPDALADEQLEESSGELDGSFETVAEGGQAGGASMGDAAQPNKADDAAVTTAAVVPRQETATLLDLKDADEGTDTPGADIFDQGEKFAKRGQPSGLSPVRVVKVFFRDIYDRRISFPREVHYDPFMDEIYMLSSGGQVNTRVTIYGQDYFPVAALGPGRGISNPMGMTVDKQGNIYVAQGETSDDAGTRIAPMIRVLNAAFFKVRDIFFAEIPGIAGNFVPQNMALGPGNDTLYISGNGAKGVLVLDLEGNFKRWLVPLKVGGVSEEMGNDPSHPGALKVEDVVVDTKGRIYILANIAGRVFVLDRDENFLFAFGELGGSTGKLSNPRSIAVDVHREVIYVVDYMRHAINAYTYKDGRYLLEFGGQGLSEGWFQFPSHIAVDRRGNVIVADMFNHRVQVMDVP